MNTLNNFNSKLDFLNSELGFFNWKLTFSYSKLDYSNLQLTTRPLITLPIRKRPDTGRHPRALSEHCMEVAVPVVVTGKLTYCLVDIGHVLFISISVYIHRGTAQLACMPIDCVQKIWLDDFFHALYSRWAHYFRYLEICIYVFNYFSCWNNLCFLVELWLSDNDWVKRTIISQNLHNNVDN